MHPNNISPKEKQDSKTRKKTEVHRDRERGVWRMTAQGSNPDTVTWRI